MSVAAHSLDKVQAVLGCTWTQLAAQYRRNADAYAADASVCRMGSRKMRGHDADFWQGQADACAARAAECDTRGVL